MEYTNSQIREIIGEYIHSERDRKIMERRLIDGITFEKLAEEFDLSVRRTKTIVYNCQVQIFKHIPE
jgi:DNA-directed RNA polymerase sigma subunit (sigma70/sigma32)